MQVNILTKVGSALKCNRSGEWGAHAWHVIIIICMCKLTYILKLVQHYKVIGVASGELMSDMQLLKQMYLYV